MTIKVEYKASYWNPDHGVRFLKSFSTATEAEVFLTNAFNKYPAKQDPNTGRFRYYPTIEKVTVESIDFYVHNEIGRKISRPEGCAEGWNDPFSENYMGEDFVSFHSKPWG